MAYVDHAFSISDEDIMMETSYSVNNKPPIKEIALALSLLVFGVLGIVLGAVMAVNKVGGDRAHGNLARLSPICFFFTILPSGVSIVLSPFPFVVAVLAWFELLLCV